MEYLRYLFFIQNFISSGNFCLEINDLIKLYIDNKKIILEIINIEKLNKIYRLYQSLKEDNKDNKKSIIDIFKNTKELFKLLNNIGKIFYENNKILIIRYNNKNIVIFGIKSFWGYVKVNIYEVIKIGLKIFK